MGPSHNLKPALRFFAAVAGLAVLGWVAALMGLWQVMKPAPQSPPPSSRAEKVVQRTTFASDERDAPEEAGPFAVSGSVRDATGAGVEKVGLHWASRSQPEHEQVLGWTDASGQFQVEVPEAGTLRAAVWSTPELVHISSDRTDVHFVGVSTCPLAVTVLAPDRTPIGEQVVRARVKVDGHMSELLLEDFTDPAGTATFEDMPCGVAEVWVRRAGHPQGRRSNVDTLVEQKLVIRLVDGVQVTGRVTNTLGDPVEDARVHSGNASDHTDEDGLYGLLVDPRNLSRVSVSADGYESQSERLRIATADAGDTELVLDFVLQSSRMVTVYCAGLPDDSCATVVPLFCTRTYLPMGEPCHGDPTLCICPEGRGAIRGGGLAVEVLPGDTEVWLDLTGRGGIRGQVSIAGRPVDPSDHRCQVIATRLPTGLEDIPGGMSAGARTSCLPDSRFELLGLKAGTYMVQVSTPAGEATEPSISVQSEVVDLGTLDIGGGGSIEGVVLDGVTGDGLPGQAVVTYQGTNNSLSGLGQAVSGAEGAFRITGLPDGTYEVILPTRPFSSVSVTVDDGHSEPIELTTGEAGLLRENGFELETDEAGQLVVGSVDSDGSAAAAGLEQGDVVVGVTLAGFDVAEVAPGYADEVTDAVLDHWGGPGVGLVVERDGERQEVVLQ